MNRNLDGCYFRVERDGKWQNICFTDLTTQERDDMLANRSVEWLTGLCCYLADVVQNIGDQFDIYGGDNDG